MNRRGLRALLIAVAVLAAACGDGDSDGAGGDDGGAGDAVAPLDADVVATATKIFASSLTLLPADVEVLAASEDERVAWLIADQMRFHGDQEIDRTILIDAAERLTGVSVADAQAASAAPLGADGRPVEWVVYTDLLLRRDVPAPPGYLDLKRSLFSQADPGWEVFFDEASPLDWREVSSGGVGRDRIVALNDPDVFRPGEPGGDWLPDDDVVFGVVIDGDARAYPRRVMEIHELVNDDLGGRRLGLPYCTLCGTAVGYLIDTDALPDGVAQLDLRTSGLLQRSNKLMYDANTESLFEQFDGVPLTGSLLADHPDLRLERVPVTTTTWGEWKRAHPDTTIVSGVRPPNRTYQADPLGERDAAGPTFAVGDIDDRLDPHVDVLGVVAPDGTSVAFPVEAARAALDAGDDVRFGDVAVSLEAGGLVATGPDGAPLESQGSRWFAWSQFRPGTELWSPGTAADG